jgi:hypothetical protein
MTARWAAVVCWTLLVLVSAVASVIEPHSVHRQIAFWATLIILNVWMATWPTTRPR